MATKASLHRHLSALERKHRTLDMEINELYRTNMADDFEIAALKREKLQLKEDIVKTEKELSELK